MWVVNDREEQSSRHKRRESNYACEEFSDIVKLLQPFPSTKMTWHSDFTFAAILLRSAFLFYSLQTLQRVDCSLLALALHLLELLLFY